MVDVFENKNALFVDLDENIVGTFGGFISDGERDHQFVMFKPLNGFFKGMKRTEYSKKKEHFFTVHASTRADGVEPIIIYHYSGGERSNLRSIISKQLLEENKKLSEKINDLQIELANAKQTSQDAMTGLSRGVSAAKDVISAKNRVEGNENAFGVPFFDRNIVE